MAQSIAVEARASYNMFSKEGEYGDHTCLSLFAPVINIMRHPLWGRNQAKPKLGNAALPPQNHLSGPPKIFFLGW